jgi:hypothetical protein
MINPLDFTDEAAYWDAVYEEAQGPATQAEADREYVRNVGAEDTERCWILSDRDVWYRNPFYRGEDQPHPEDEYEREAREFDAARDEMK